MVFCYKKMFSVYLSFSRPLNLGAQTLIPGYQTWVNISSDSLYLKNIQYLNSSQDLMANYRITCFSSRAQDRTQIRRYLLTIPIEKILPQLYDVIHEQPKIFFFSFLAWIRNPVEVQALPSTVPTSYCLHRRCNCY